MGRSQLKEIDHSELILRAREHDEGALEELYELFHRQVYGLCLKILKDHHNAEDIVQEAFLIVCRDLSQFRGDSQFKTWLYRVAISRAIMYLRKTKLTKGTISLDEAGAEFASPDKQLTLVPERIDLVNAIDRLAPAESEILRLRFVEGFTHFEIGEMLACTIPASKSRCRRARIALAAILKDQARPIAVARA